MRHDVGATADHVGRESSSLVLDRCSAKRRWIACQRARTASSDWTALPLVFAQHADALGMVGTALTPRGPPLSQRERGLAATAA